MTEDRVPPGKHVFLLRREGRRAGKRVLAAYCPCGWTSTDRHGLLGRRAAASRLRGRWMRHT